MFPPPVPELLIVSVCPPVGVKFAETFCAALTVSVHEAVPAQPPPLQPLKAEFTPGVAVSVTEVAEAKGAEQFVPQLMPAGAL